MHRRAFSSVIRARGMEYWRSGQVGITDLSDDRASAVVSGTREYEGTLIVDGDATPLAASGDSASFRSVPDVAQPESFTGELRAYQRHGLRGLHFLREFGLGGCLADDMGLGKTVQVLALLAGLRERKRSSSRPSLLVAPRSVLPNWMAEAGRFAPRLRVLDLSGADRWERFSAADLRHHDLLLTTYGMLRHDAPRFVEQDLRFHYAILDESQMAKNADSQTSKATRLLRAEHRLAFTGTPVENHLGERWSLFEFLNPGMLGRLPVFRALFGKDAHATTMARHREIVQRALRPVLQAEKKALCERSWATSARCSRT